MEFSTNKNDFNSQELYDNNIMIFKELDYTLSRYDIKYCIVIIKFLNATTDITMDKLKSLLRLSDRVAYIKKGEFLIFLTHSDENQAYGAILALEKRLNKKISYANIFNCSIVEVKKGENSRHKLNIACSLISSCDENIYIILEDTF